MKSSDSTQLLLLATGVDTTVPIATFSGPVVDLTNVSGVPVALRLFVAEVEKTGVPLAPDGANFWLFGIP